MTAYLAKPARQWPLSFNKDETRQFIRGLAKRLERNKTCGRERIFGAGDGQ